MKIYRVQMPVHASFSTFVRADSREEALKKAEEFEGHSVPICWQCAQTLDEALVGEVGDSSDVFEVEEGDEEAERFFEDWGDDE